MSRPATCVIFNPRSGRTRALRRLERVRDLWGDRAEILQTEHVGHAEQLAEAAARLGARTVVAVGGDGTVHEVANGLLRSEQPDVILGVTPVGSANDYAWSLRREFNAQACTPHCVDVGRVRTESGRERYFLCALGAGLNGRITFESRRIRSLRGLGLYGLATLRALRSYREHPHWELTLDAGQPICGPSLMLSVMLAQREGNFRMAPQAALADGWFDYVHAGPLSRGEVLRHLPRLAFSGPPTCHPHVRLGRCQGVRLKSNRPLCVHTDGELLCTPDEDVRSLDVELLPGRLNVQLCPVL